jgi:hypothetical protein
MSPDEGKMLFQALARNTKTSLLYLNLRQNDFHGMLAVDYIGTFKTLRRLYLPRRDDATQRSLFVEALHENTVRLDCRCSGSDGR